MTDRSLLLVAVALGVGVAMGPALAGWAQRSVSANSVSGWWRGCGVPSPWAVAATVLSGVLFAVVALRFAGSATLPAWCWLVATGIVLAIVDLRHRRLPHRLTAAMAFGGLLLLAIAAVVEDRWPQLVSAMLAGSGVLAAATVVQMVFPAHTGGGDTALYGALAVFLGWFGWSGLLRGMLLATALTALVAIGMWVARGRAVAFPAGPSLVAGTVVAVLLP